ncbi:MAG: RNA ligase family protein [Mariniblastus sp.]
MAKLNLVYPKMPGSGSAPLENCIAFDKYDGTNLHWVWDHDLGWHAFGTRRDRFDLDSRGISEFAQAHRGLGEAPAIFQNQFAAPLAAVIAANELLNASTEIIIFTEFLGKHSFAGRHKQGDPKRLVLIDVQIDTEFLTPEIFISTFDSLPIAQVIYRGRLDGKFATYVREGAYDVAEGVVCKGGKTGAVWMVKIKTDAYMAKLKESFANKWEDYWE